MNFQSPPEGLVLPSLLPGMPPLLPDMPTACQPLPLQGQAGRAHFCQQLRLIWEAAGTHRFLSTGTEKEQESLKASVPRWP